MFLNYTFLLKIILGWPNSGHFITFSSSFFHMNNFIPSERITITNKFQHGSFWVVWHRTPHNSFQRWFVLPFLNCDVFAFALNWYFWYSLSISGECCIANRNLQRTAVISLFHWLGCLTLRHIRHLCVLTISMIRSSGDKVGDVPLSH